MGKGSFDAKQIQPMISGARLLVQQFVRLNSPHHDNHPKVNNHACKKLLHNNNAALLKFPNFNSKPHEPWPVSRTTILLMPIDH